MLRQNLKIARDHDPHFEWRGHDVTRMENLSDIVFALAFGMLVMSGDPPRTFEQLNAFLINVVPVTLGFVVMFAIWNGHYTFFRRYALADKKVGFLNSLILLLVLVLAYPLRFIFDGLYGYVLMHLGDLTLVNAMRIDFQRAGIIMGYFTSGFAVMQTLFALLYSHALSKKEALELSELEVQLTKLSIWEYWAGAGCAIIATIGAVLTPLGGFAGFFMNATFLTNRVMRRHFLRGFPKPEAS